MNFLHTRVVNVHRDINAAVAASLVLGRVPLSPPLAPDILPPSSRVPHTRAHLKSSGGGGGGDGRGLALDERSGERTRW